MKKGTKHKLSSILKIQEAALKKGPKTEETKKRIGIANKKSWKKRKSTGLPITYAEMLKFLENI